MSSFNFSSPLLRDKQTALDVQDLQGILNIEWKIWNKKLFSSSYTRIDQVFIIWGLVAAIIFTTAQFMPISWTTQAICWSALSLIATAIMVAFTWFWVSVERLRWVVCCWVLLVLTGVTITDLGIFLGWGEILMRLCPLWLGLSAIGYFYTGLGLRSRTLILNSLVHIGAIALLPYIISWQFLATGLVMGFSLLILAQLQWDMRSPIEYKLLTLEQREFNRQQQQLRSI